MALMQRWLVIWVKRGLVKEVTPFTKLNPAKSLADKIGDNDDPADDYVIVWDVAIGRPVYGPF